MAGIRFGTSVAGSLLGARDLPAHPSLPHRAGVDASVQTKHAIHGLPLRRPDELIVCDTHRVESALQLPLPVLQKRFEAWEYRRQVVLLPDIQLQKFGMIGNTVMDLRGGEAIAL